VLRYAATRIAGLVGTLLVTSFVVFGGLYLSPGGPLNTLLGGRTASPEQVKAVTELYDLDQPFLERYASFLGDLVRGDLGTSLVFRQPVADLLAPRIGVTVVLIVFALVLVVLLGVALGLLGGLRGGRVDSAVVVLSSVGLATPAFVAAILLIALFAVQLGWFPVFGAGEGFFDRLWHLTLPAIAMAASGQALVARVTRASVREEARREHVETARSRGIPERDIIRRHVLRNALIPIATVGGVTVAGLLAGAVVVENAFGLGGLGSLLVSSIQAKDYAVVQIIALLFVATFVVVNTLVDLLYVAIDPRVRPWERA
jgi:peptide/nickel transport system permease protein